MSKLKLVLLTYSDDVMRTAQILIDAQLIKPY